MQIRIYTDGACSGNPGPGGWAMVVNTDTQCKTHGGYAVETTNNRMELTAVNEALRRIAKHKSQDDVFAIYSDSAYVVNAITKQWLQSWQQNGWKTKADDEVKNRDLWEQTAKYLSAIKNTNRKVRLIKIKGHAGNTFNEMVDKLAKEQSMLAQSMK